MVLTQCLWNENQTTSAMLKESDWDKHFGCGAWFMSAGSLVAWGLKIRSDLTIGYKKE